MGGSTLQDQVDRWCAGERSESVRAAIAAAAHALAVKAARAARLGLDEAEDVAQAATSRFLRRYLQRLRTVRSADAVVWQIARNLSRDFHRRAAVKDRATDALARSAAGQQTWSEDPEARAIAAEEQIATQRLVRAGLASAPHTYRLVLERHYLLGHTLEEIASDYLREMLEAGELSDLDDDLAAKRARNRVDQHLSRGRRWLRKWILEAMEAGE